MCYLLLATLIVLFLIYMLARRDKFMPYRPSYRQCANTPEYWSVEECAHPVSDSECYI